MSIRDRFVEILNENVPLKDLSVFEPGCGDGIFTRRLAESAKEVHASDARAEQVAETKRRCVGKKNAKIEKRDAEKEYPAGGALDVTFHVGLLYHLKDPVAHLRKICVLTKSAVFLDTHYATREACNGHYRMADGETILCHEQAENPDALRAGLHQTSRWITKERIIAELLNYFTSVVVIDDRQERNGPRITILAKRS